MRALKSDLVTAAGAAMMVGAAVSAELAWLAARGVAGLDTICGAAGQPDCPYLIAAAALFVSGGSTLLAALRTPKQAPISAP